MASMAMAQPQQNIFAQRALGGPISNAMPMRPGMPGMPVVGQMPGMSNLAMRTGPGMTMQPGAGGPIAAPMPGRPVMQPGQMPNVNAPGMPQPGGFAQPQNFMRQRMMGAM